MTSSPSARANSPVSTLSTRSMRSDDTNLGLDGMYSATVLITDQQAGMGQNQSNTAPDAIVQKIHP